MPPRLIASSAPGCGQSNRCRVVGPPIAAFEPVEIGAGVERGSANEVQSLLADLFAALGIALDGALRLADDRRSFSGEAGCLVQVANLATCSIPTVLCLGVEFFVDGFAPGRLLGPIGRAEFGTAGADTTPSELLRATA